VESRSFSPVRRAAASAATEDVHPVSFKRSAAGRLWPELAEAGQTALRYLHA
jgi:hypothetical protein